MTRIYKFYYGKIRDPPAIPMEAAKDLEAEPPQLVHTTVAGGEGEKGSPTMTGYVGLGQGKAVM